MGFIIMEPADVPPMSGSNSICVATVLLEKGIIPITNSKMKIFNPAGEWNSSKIIFTEKQVEHWLNGKKVLSFTPWSEEWYERKSAGMYRDNEDYGEYRTGYIGFQDYGNDLSFRNIIIKKH